MLELATFYPLEPTIYRFKDIEYGMVRNGYAVKNGEPVFLQLMRHLFTPKVVIKYNPNGSRPEKSKYPIGDSGLIEAPHRGLGDYLQYIKEVPNGIL